MAVAAALLLLLLVAPAAYAVQHIVGDRSGWTETVDYSDWVRGKTFTVGDTLVFNYGSSHRVDEVTRSDYTNCETGNAIDSHSDGNTIVTLSKAGTMYFICPVLGHCSSGMKLAVDVVATSGTSPATPSTRSGSSTPSGATTVVNNGSILGFSLVLGVVLAIMS
ncbi:hypothetical protein HRI_003495200 [Hibiscus trionum]|uniref:Phytocyanin domain-containing protein n=1 Tax=Hibiscus trionum TaxID=183268 RepID=A0A9W7ILF0_HIBTR|nr:hypothetical protein HRI_003495200 [Hibiscus trionum]